MPTPATAHTTVPRMAAEAVETKLLHRDIFTPAQWKTLFAFTETVIRPVPVDELKPGKEGVDPEAFERFANATANEDNLEFANMAAFLIATSTSASARAGFAFVLDMLNYKAGCLLLTYSPTPFHLQPVEVREQIIRDWANPFKTSLFPAIRTWTLAMLAITRMSFFRGVPDAWQDAVGYVDFSGAGKAWERDEEGKVKSAGSKPVPQGEESGYYQFSFEEPKDVEDQEWDVIIVGSGCGGAVTAKRCAEAGLKTLVVEKGTWVPTEELPLKEDDACKRLYEGGFFVATEDVSVTIIAGSTFGGGGVVNWAASLQTQAFVREEWATKHGLPFFLSQDFQNSLDFVCERMGVEKEGINHNQRNSTLLEGAKKVGYHGYTVGQNSEGAHHCGYCGYGCGGEPGKRKMGTTQTWLPDAARAGAKFMTTFDVRSVTFADSYKTKATGITGFWGPDATPVTIKAKRVVVSSGSINSPALLLRSGLRNPQIGRNFHCHPVNIMQAWYPESTDPMKGSPLTTAVTSLENLDLQGHGQKLETPMMTIGSLSPVMPWYGVKEWKQQIADFDKMSMYISIHREKNPGRIWIDDLGKPRIDYTVSKEDRKMMVEGVIGMAKIVYAAGATKIVGPVHGYPMFERYPEGESAENGTADDELAAAVRVLELEDPGILDPRFQKWLQGLRDTGLPTPGTQFGSAHQMSSCRMSAREGDGVVDPKGKVWGVEGLYVSDASVLPTASGVNPMISTMAVANWVAVNVCEDLGKRVPIKGEV